VVALQRSLTPNPVPRARERKSRSANAPPSLKGSEGDNVSWPARPPSSRSPSSLYCHPELAKDLPNSLRIDCKILRCTRKLASFRMTWVVTMLSSCEAQMSVSNCPLMNALGGGVGVGAPGATDALRQSPSTHGLLTASTSAIVWFRIGAQGRDTHEGRGLDPQCQTVCQQ
jgi:hypothetical protein